MAARADSDGVDVDAWATDDGADDPKSETRPQQASTKKLQPRLVAVVPACSGNDLRGGRNDGVMCAGAINFCRDVGGFLAWVLTTTTIQNPTPDDWEISNQRCVRPGEEAALARPRQVPAFTARDLARLKLPAGGMHLQPDSGEVLINVPTNAYVTAPTVKRRAQLLDLDVEVEAIASKFTWTFGDGGRLVATSPGHPYPDMTTTHTYTRHGRYQVTLTTTYGGRYRIVGEPDWLPITGTVDIASPPQTLTAIAPHAVLVP